MKFLIHSILIAICSVSFNAYAQKDSISTIFGKSKVQVEWNGLLTLNYHNVNSNVKPGLAIGAIINQHFVLGAFAQFSSGNFAMPYKGYQNNIITQDFGIIVGALSYSFTKL